MTESSPAMARCRAVPVPALTADASVYFAKLAGAGEMIGCSAYVAFAYLADLDRLSPEAARRIGDDRAAIYHWYLTDYAARHEPLRVPLSAADIAWLLAPDVDLGFCPRVVARFAAIERPDLLVALSSATGTIALARWWALERAPALGVDDCLVPDSFAAILRRSDAASPNASGSESSGSAGDISHHSAAGQLLSRLETGDRLQPRLELGAPAHLTIKSDICVIGPLRQRSGLGQAARLSIEAFERAGVKVSVLDFEHGFPSPRRCCIVAYAKR